MLPLSGIKVVEFCQVAAGPFCGMLLADMGADVIKVESPDGGDGLRQWPPLNRGDSENFASINRNKRSVALNLKDPADREAARRLALSADVVVENFRPGVLGKLGLGYDDLAKDKPSLVYCSISAFGQSGPRSQEGGFDLTVQAIGGVMSVTGEAGGPPVKCGVPLADFGAGLYAAYAISCALHAARRDGRGDYRAAIRYLAEHDADAMRAFTRAAGIQVVGDDFFVTDEKRVRAAGGACNAVLLKPNQVGTVTETLACWDAARAAGYRGIVSARSGESEDVSIVHLAVGWGVPQLKVGSFSRSERMAKWNEALRIEEALGGKALLYPARKLFKP